MLHGAATSQCAEPLPRNLRAIVNCTQGPRPRRKDLRLAARPRGHRRRVHVLRRRVARQPARRQLGGEGTARPRPRGWPLWSSRMIIRRARSPSSWGTQRPRRAVTCTSAGARCPTSRSSAFPEAAVQRRAPSRGQYLQRLPAALGARLADLSRQAGHRGQAPTKAHAPSATLAKLDAGTDLAVDQGLGLTDKVVRETERYGACLVEGL